MKKILILILLIFCICMSGCSLKKQTDNSSVNISQVETETELSHKASLINSITKSKLRDPFVLLYEENYYIYTTGWNVCKTDDFRVILDNMPCVVKPDDYAGDSWAPEVYYYKDKFYMFTTYRSTLTGKRGCAIFVSDTPDGQFVLHSEGHITPKDWDSIDGTFYIDEDGQPWMVFVHEWTSTDDGVGRMACAKLSDDLTHLISEPIELFRADSASWDRGKITDGCYIYRTQNGSLKMLWSSADAYGYCVGIATSVSGNVEGPWIQAEEPFFSKKLTGLNDGGHGMIFKDLNGYMWMSIHTPNSSEAKAAFIPIKEENNNIVWDLVDRKIY